jgi:hypothetical protein
MEEIVALAVPAEVKDKVLPHKVRPRAAHRMPRADSVPKVRETAQNSVTALLDALGAAVPGVPSLPLKSCKNT